MSLNWLLVAWACVLAVYGIHIALRAWAEWKRYRNRNRCEAILDIYKKDVVAHPRCSEARGHLGSHRYTGDDE